MVCQSGCQVTGQSDVYIRRLCKFRTYALRRRCSKAKTPCIPSRSRGTCSQQTSDPAGPKTGDTRSSVKPCPFGTLGTSLACLACLAAILQQLSPTETGVDKGSRMI